MIIFVHNSYYDSFENSGVLMIEMEYADGGSLDQFLSNQTQPLSELQVLLIFQQIIHALRYIHTLKKPLLHRYCHLDSKRNTAMLEILQSMYTAKVRT